MLHIEVNHFIRLFKWEVGVTPYRYMLTHRLNVASSYIAAGGSVTEAARLGYESVAALSHALRRRTEQERYRPPVFIPSQQIFGFENCQRF